MSPDEIEDLADETLLRERRRGELILQRLDAGGDLYIVIDGVVVSNRYSLSGREIAFRRIRPGGYFGELSAVDELPHSANAIALTDVRLGQIPARRVKRLIDTSPPFARALLQALAERARDLRQRMFEMSSLTVPTRLHVEILRFASEAGIRNGQAAIAPSPTHAEFASLVSGQREAVSREFARLQAMRIVARRGRNLQVLDVRRLAELAHQGGFD